MFLVFFPVKRNKRGIIFTCIQSLLKLSWLLYKFHNYLLVSIDAVLVLPSQHLQTSWSSFSLLVIYKTQKYFQFTDTYENQLHLWTTGRTKNIYRQLHVWEQTTNGRTRNIYGLLVEPETFIDYWENHIHYRQLVEPETFMHGLLGETETFTDYRQLAEPETFTYDWEDQKCILTSSKGNCWWLWNF